MKTLFTSPSWVLTSFLIVVFSILLCLLILKIVRRKFSFKELEKNHHVVGCTFSIIGVLYSVILGFTVINVQTQYNSVLETVHTEAILLADLYQDAAYFSAEDRDAIRLSLERYLHHILKEEWWVSNTCKINIPSQMLIKNIWDSYYNVNLINEKMKIWYTESIAKLNNFLNARLSRQFNAWVHLGALMWTLLILGGIIVVCFMFFFGMEDTRSHMILTSLLVGYLVFILYLIYTLDTAFKGEGAVRPVALEQVQSLFDEWNQETSSTAAP